MTKQISLKVNEQPIKLDYFVQDFIDHTIHGLLASLRDAREMREVEISIEGDKLDISLDKAILPANPFVSKIVRNTILGMVSSLKGVGEINSVSMVIKK